MSEYGMLVILLSINLPSVQYTRVKELRVLTVGSISKQEAEHKMQEFKDANKHLPRNALRAYWQPERHSIEFDESLPRVTKN